MAADENKELVRRVQYDTYTGDEDLDVIDEFVSHDPFVGDVHGPDEFKEYVESFTNAFTDITFTVHHIVAEDDLVASYATVGGVHEGTIPGLDLEPTGEEVEIEAMEFDRVENGKLVESWLLPDTLGLFQQLGDLSDQDVPTE